MKKVYNMKRRMFGKGLAVAVIILFLGVSIQPVIATVQLEDRDVEYFDVTTEFVGLNKKYTTQLTKEELEELNALFDSVSSNLNKSTSFKESVEIFRDSIINLDKFGLLGNVGIKESEKLVTNYFQNSMILKMLERLYNRKNVPLNEDENRFCLILGITSGLILINPAHYNIIYILFKFLVEHRDIDIYTLAFLAITLIWGPALFNPFCLGRMIAINFDWASGMIVTFGIDGLKQWYGYLNGKMNFEVFEVLAFGFTGLKIEIITYPKQYFFGFARHVHIEDYWPTKEV
jgi:hypothetical protein